jgi:putative ABC transport system ATP-binding protein
MANPQSAASGNDNTVSPISVSTPAAPMRDDYNASEHIVRVRNVKRTYYIGENPVHALRGISLDIRRGEFMAIMGPSGSGKSTLFNMVGGLDKPTEGTVFIDEVDISQLDPGELAWLRCRKIGYIFQTFNLIPVMTALENVTLPMIFAGASLDEQMERGKKLLEMVGLEHRLHNKPGQLSGGQQQRVAIARALANDPAIILADEPTGNLDQKVGEEIIQMLKRLNKESGVTIITATHDDKMYKRSDRVSIVIDGEIQAVVPPDQLGDNTVDGFLAQLKEEKDAEDARLAAAAAK